MSRSLLTIADAGRVTVGASLLWASCAKLTMMHLGMRGERFGIDAFAAHIAEARVISAPISGPVAWTTTLAEVVVGLWLLSHFRPRLSAAFGVGLLALFSGYLVAAAIRPDGSCPCLGTREAARAPWPFVRNGLLILVLVPSLIWSSTRRTRA